MQTRSKGKDRQLMEAEAQNQLKALREEEFICELLHQQIQAKRRMLLQIQTLHGEGTTKALVEQAWQPTQATRHAYLLYPTVYTQSTI
jgi:hypothetical protein